MQNTIIVEQVRKIYQVRIFYNCTMGKRKVNNLTGDTMSELKPCPFCGGKAEIEDFEYFPDCANEPEKWKSVGCFTDGCVCERHCDGVYCESEIEAVKKWNTRAESN